MLGCLLHCVQIKIRNDFFHTVFLEGTDIEPLNTGGNYFLSSASLASGIGILKEKYAPYVNSEGNAEKSGDWSLPEEDRFAVSFELKNANMLPSPASFDAEGSYVYRPEATEAIKSELLAGRAVGISFKADKSMPEKTPEEKREMLEKDLADVTQISLRTNCAISSVCACASTICRRTAMTLPPLTAISW